MRKSVFFFFAVILAVGGGVFFFCRGEGGPGGGAREEVKPSPDPKLELSEGTTDDVPSEPGVLDDAWAKDVLSRSPQAVVAEARAYFYFEWLKKGARNEDGARRLKQPELPVSLFGLGPEGLLFVSYQDSETSARVGLLDPETGEVRPLSPPGRDYNGKAVFNTAANLAVYVGGHEDSRKVYGVDLNGNEKVLYTFAEGEGSGRFVSDPVNERVYFFVHDDKDIFGGGRFMSLDLRTGTATTVGQIDKLCNSIAYGPGPDELTFRSYGKDGGDDKLQVLSFSEQTSSVRDLSPNTYAKLMGSFESGTVKQMSWLPGGKILSITAWGSGAEPQVYLLSGDDADAQQVTRSGAQGAFWSADGSRMYFHAAERDVYPSQVYELAVPGDPGAGGAN